MVVDAKDFMNKDVVTIDVAGSALDAANLMAKREVGSLVVLQNNKPVGIITDRDIVVDVIAKGLDPSKVRVGEFMSKPLITARLETPMLEIAKMMDEHGIRRVPIVEGNKVVGIVTSTDLGKASKILAPYLLSRIPEIYLTPKKRSM